MKIFYLGSVCDDNTFNKTVKESKVKPSASAQNFENALLTGVANIPNIDLSIASAESIAMYPNSNRLYLCKRTASIRCGLNTIIIPALNLPIFKQICHANGTSKLLKNWLSENNEDKNKCVVVYGIYPLVTKKMQNICKKYNCKIFAIIADMPSLMFTYSKKNGLKKIFAKSYRKTAITLQDKFDGYIYLTKAMASEVAPGKPYLVVETIAEPTIFDEYPDVEKAKPPALMYAGALYQKYGLEFILNAFEKIKSDCELWLFGSGDYEVEIKRRSELNHRIKFMGRLSRAEILLNEKKATLLLNIRNADDEYTRYSFPSKMIEYMLSGTPLLTTKLPGVPDEYDAYCYTTTTREEQSVAEQVDQILQSGDLKAFGEKARKFVLEHKNCNIQAKKILAFLKLNI